MKCLKLVQFKIIRVHFDYKEMQSQCVDLCEKCSHMLHQSNQRFQRVLFLKKLAQISSYQNWRKSSLFLYCLYCIIHKFDYVEALESIEKAQGIDEGSYMSIAISKLNRSLLYTFIDKHQQSLNLIKQACALLKLSDSISLEMKDHYKRMIPIVVNNLNLSNGKKSFFKLFNQVYDDLAKQTNQNQLNEEILYSIHSKIQELKSKIDFIPTVKMNSPRVSNQIKTLQKSKSANKVLNESYESSDYAGFNKEISREEKSINNIQKMISLQRQKKIHTSPKNIDKKVVSNKILLKNQPNPYQLNLYADQTPKCQFM